MKQMKRMFVSRAGRKTQKFILVRPPFPKVGSVVTIKGEDWICKRIESADDAIEIKFPVVRARKVFP